MKIDDQKNKRNLKYDVVCDQHNLLQIWKYGVYLKILKKQNKLKKYNVIEIIMLKKIIKMK